MPERQDLHEFGSLPNAIIQVIMDAAQIYPPHACQLAVSRSRSDAWLLSDQGQSSAEFFLQSFRSCGPIGLPPVPGLPNLAGGAPDNLY
jgi:hypothetical protein